MNRYLINVSYIGTNFLGIQKIPKINDLSTVDLTTIQGQLERAMRKLKNIRNIPAVVTSSRTDSGVHALHSTIHVDLERYGGELFKTTHITGQLNKYFTKQEVPIRIIKTYLVPSDFHCRSAISRTYLYRLAVPKLQNNIFNYGCNHIPIEDINRCYYYCSKDFNLEKFRGACKLFLGTHDFRTFMGRSNHDKRKNKITRRNIDMLDIYKVDTPKLTDFSIPGCVRDNYIDFTHYNVVIKSSGFLYKQIRRTLGALLAVASSTITARDIKFMLEVPSYLSWHPALKSAPAHGLYLSEVAYREEDYDTFREIL